MEKAETIDDVLSKKGSLAYVWAIIDPENKYAYSTAIKEWYRLSLLQQRRLYLYLLYRKWRGEGFYGTPYEIVNNCHPYPTNWNGRPLINRLMKENKLVRAKHQGDFGIYTVEEAKVWQMSEVKPLN